MLWLVAVLLPGSFLAGVPIRSSGSHIGKIAETKVVVIVGWHLDVFAIFPPRQQRPSQVVIDRIVI